MLITPAYAHSAMHGWVRSGDPPAMTLGSPGVQGPVGTGTQGIGVRVPSAAAVAAATAGLAILLQRIKEGMFNIGTISAMVPTSVAGVVIAAPLGRKVRGIGALPIVHWAIAPVVTAKGMLNPPFLTFLSSLEGQRPT